jgi:hypothetical protein
MSKLSSTANFLRAMVMPPLRRRCASVPSTRRPSGMNGMSRQRQYQLRHKSAGLCYDCSRPAAHGTLFCEVHRRKRNLENRERQRKRFNRKIRYQKAESYKFKGSKAYEHESAYIFRSAMLARIFAAGVQKVSAQLEVSKPARKIVLNNQ